MNDVVDKIKEKYPEYQSIPDDELTIKIYAKYPQYAYNSSFSSDIVRIRNDAGTKQTTRLSPALEQDVLAKEVGPQQTGVEQFAGETLSALQEDVTKILPKPVRTVLTYNPIVESIKAVGKKIGSPATVGVGEGLENLAEGIRSPVGLATMGMGDAPVVVQRAVSIGFATQMAMESPEIARQLGDEFGKPEGQRDNKKIARLLTQGGGVVGFTTIAAKHGLSVKEPELSLTPQTTEALKQTTGKEPNASPIRSDAGQVQEVNATQGSEGQGSTDIQQQTSGASSYLNAPRQESVSSQEPGAVGVLGPESGMGAAKTGETPAKSELAQLTDSVKTLAEQNPKVSQSTAFDLGETVAGVKDSASRAAAGLKAASELAKQKLIGKPVVTDYDSALGQRHLELSESAINARKFVKNSERAVPDEKTQSAISNYIDTGGDPAVLDQAIAETKSKYKAGYEAAKNLTPEQKTLAGNVKNYFESRLQDAIDAGVLEDGIEDYIHRTYESDSPWKRGIIAELRSGIFTGKPALAKQRAFEYDFEAEKAGLSPIKSFIKRIAAYDLSLNKAIADRKLIKSLMQIKMPDGRPMIDVGGLGTKIEGPTGETDATLIKPAWRPTDPDTPIKNRADFKYYDHPSLRKWKWATSDENGKPIFVQGDVLVHPDAIGKVKALFEKSAIRANPIGRAALGVSSTVKQTMLDLSGFHPVQITVHGWEHRTFKPVSEIDFTNPDVRGLIKGGAVVGETTGRQLFDEGLTGSSLTRHIPILGKRLQAYNEWLFNEYIPKLKMAMGLHALERNRAKYKDLTPDEMNRLTANQMNAAFGELNYEMLGRSRTMQDALRLSLLAPDFLEARSRFASQAVTKYGSEQRVALIGGAAALYLTARLINKLLTDEYHFEPKNAFSVVYGGKAYSLRTVQGDILHLAQEPGKFAYTRLNPLYGRTGFEFLTGRDYFGRKRTYPQQAKDLATTMTPISLRGILNPREQSLAESLMNAFGITERRASPVSTIANLVSDFKEKNKIRTEPGEFIYDPDKDPFRPITQAATYSDAQTVAKEIANSVKGGNVTKEQIRQHFLRYATQPFTGSRKHDVEFVKSLSDDNKKIYQDALAERRSVLKKFNEGYRIYLQTK